MRILRNASLFNKQSNIQNCNFDIMMPLSEIFFLGIVLYLLYGFVFNFIIPIFRTTKHVRQQFRNMQDPGMQDQTGPFQSFTGRNSGEQAGQSQGQQGGGQRGGAAANGAKTQGSRTESSKNTMGEYIDFEEIK